MLTRQKPVKGQKIVTKKPKPSSGVPAQNLIARQPEPETKMPEKLVVKPIEKPNVVIVKPQANMITKPQVASPVPTQEVAGWKKKLAEMAPKAKVIRPKTETWDKLKEEQVEKRKRGELLEIGLVIIIDGLSKAGKTRFLCSATSFHGYQGKRFNVVPGNPVFVLDTEKASDIEANVTYPEEYDKGDIIVKRCYIEKKGVFDPKASFDELEEWALSLQSTKSGTLGIDKWSDACDWVIYKLLERLNISWDDDGIPDQKISPNQYVWKNIKLKTLLKRLRNLGLNIILVCQSKEEVVKTGKGVYDFEKTGGLLTEGAKGQEGLADFICRFEKETDKDGNIKYSMLVTDSRFESKTLKRYKIDGEPTFSSLIELIKEKL